MKKMLILLTIIPLPTLSVYPILTSINTVTTESKIDLGELKFDEIIDVDFGSSKPPTSTEDEDIFWFYMFRVLDYLEPIENTKDKEMKQQLIGDIFNQPSTFKFDKKNLTFIDAGDSELQSSLKIEANDNNSDYNGTTIINFRSFNSKDKSKIYLFKYQSVFKNNPIEIIGDSSSTPVENILRQEPIIINLIDKHLTEQHAPEYKENMIIEDFYSFDIKILKNIEGIPKISIIATENSKYFENWTSINIPISIKRDILRFEEKIEKGAGINSNSKWSNVVNSFATTSYSLNLNEKLNVDFNDFKIKYNKIEFVITGLITDWDGQLINVDRVFFIDIKKLSNNKFNSEELVSFSKHDGLAYEQANMSIEYKTSDNEILFSFNSKVEIKIISMHAQEIDYNYKIKSIFIK